MGTWSAPSAYPRARDRIRVLALGGSDGASRSTFYASSCQRASRAWRWRTLPRLIRSRRSSKSRSNAWSEDYAGCLPNQRLQHETAAWRLSAHRREASSPCWSPLRFQTWWVQSWPIPQARSCGPIDFSLSSGAMQSSWSVGGRAPPFVPYPAGIGPSMGDRGMSTANLRQGLRQFQCGGRRGNPDRTRNRAELLISGGDDAGALATRMCTMLTERSRNGGVSVWQFVPLWPAMRCFRDPRPGCGVDAIRLWWQRWMGRGWRPFDGVAGSDSASARRHVVAPYSVLRGREDGLSLINDCGRHFGGIEQRVESVAIEYRPLRITAWMARELNVNERVGIQHHEVRQLPFSMLPDRDVSPRNSLRHST